MEEGRRKKEDGIRKKENRVLLLMFREAFGVVCSVCSSCASASEASGRSSRSSEGVLLRSRQLALWTPFSFDDA